MLQDSQQILGKGGTLVFIQLRQKNTQLIHVEFSVLVEIVFGQHFLDAQTRSHELLKNTVCCRSNRPQGHLKDLCKVKHWGFRKLCKAKRAGI
jgi:hypothetical protein